MNIIFIDIFDSKAINDKHEKRSHIWILSNRRLLPLPLVVPYLVPLVLVGHLPWSRVLQLARALLPQGCTSLLAHE